MLVHAKKVTCLSLLAELASAPLPPPQRIGSPTTIPFLTTGNIDTLFACLSFLHRSPDLRTPKLNGHFGSPENYFRIPQRTAPASRWKEDWEELELLVF